MEQLDMFSIDHPDITPIERVSQNDPIFLRKWRMLEYMEGLKSETAIIHYEDKGVSYRVPIMIGDTHFLSNSIASRPTNLVIPCTLESRHSKVSFRGRLTAIERKEGIHYLHYNKEVDKVCQECCSKVLLETKSYSLLKQTFQKYDESQGLQQLIGTTLRAELRCDQDLVYSIETVPFKVVSVKVEGDSLTIVGSNDVLIQTTGFKGVRYNSDLLIDVYHEHNGFTHTIHLR